MLSMVFMSSNTLLHHFITLLKQNVCLTVNISSGTVQCIISNKRNTELAHGLGAFVKRTSRFDLIHNSVNFVINYD